MPNIVIQQIKIAEYKNIFVMLIKSNCELSIINGPSEKWELSGFRTEGLVWSKLEATITECPLRIFYIWLSICSRTKYPIMKKIEEGVFFSRSFWNLKKV